jgi:Trypsin-co-occurring domain 1
MPEILLEVKPPAGASGDLARRSLKPEDFGSRADEIAESLVEVAERFRSRLGELIAERAARGWALDEVQLTFSLDVQAAAGVIIARASAGATFEASLRWKASSALE